MHYSRRRQVARFNVEGHDFAKFGRSEDFHFDEDFTQANVTVGLFFQQLAQFFVVQVAEFNGRFSEGQIFLALKLDDVTEFTKGEHPFAFGKLAESGIAVGLSLQNRFEFLGGNKTAVDQEHAEWNPFGVLFVVRAQVPPPNASEAVSKSGPMSRLSRRSTLFCSIGSLDYETAKVNGQDFAIGGISAASSTTQRIDRIAKTRTVAICRL